MKPEDADRLLARWLVGELGNSDIHQLASDLLDAGEETPTLIDLFTMDPADPADSGWELLPKILKELGARDLDEEQAWRLLATEAAEGIASGAIAPLQGAKRLLELYWRTGHEHIELTIAYDWEERLEWPTVRQREAGVVAELAAVESEVRAEAGVLADELRSRPPRAHHEGL
jgi:hypothetical protein